MLIVDWLNKNGDAVTAAATAVTAILTLFLAWWARASVAVATAIRNIETQRDEALDPLVYFHFHGYDGQRTAHLTLHNSGNRSLFLSSLRIDVPESQIEHLIVGGAEKTRESTVRDVVVPTDKPLGITFKYNGMGSHFDVWLQLYTGVPIRLRIDPSTLNGYLVRARNSTKLEILESRAFQPDLRPKRE